MYYPQENKQEPRPQLSEATIAAYLERHGWRKPRDADKIWVLDHGRERSFLHFPPFGEEPPNPDFFLSGLSQVEGRSEEEILTEMREIAEGFCPCCEKLGEALVSLLLALEQQECPQKKSEAGTLGACLVQKIANLIESHKESTKEKP